MVKQIINTGVEGNDGTGDSIRDAFRKANENFTELYAVFGQGGQIGFTSLSDTPDVLGALKVPVSNASGTALTMRSFTSGTGISISLSNPNTIQITNTGSEFVADTSPTAGGPVDLAGFGIGRAAVSSTAVSDFNATHGASITIDDLVITKGYADQRYIKAGGGSGVSGQIRVREEPVDATQYTKTIGSYTAGNVVITAHGYDTSVNGLEITYETTGSAATGLVDGNNYFLRFVNENQLSLHSTEAGAVNNTGKITVSGGTGVQTITDAAYDSSLQGFFSSDEALPRRSVVRRQGDDMEGALFLFDHPGDLAGLGTPNGAEDLQAATKFYVDNTSYSSPTNLFVSTLGDDNMEGVPPDKVGSSFSYAYKTINAACAKAEEIVFATPVELGPYKQTITYNSGAGLSLVVTEGVTSSSGYNNAKVLIDGNRTFIIKQMIAFVNTTYPNFTYDELICERDLGYILDGIVIDLLAGLNANVRSIQAGVRYYSSQSGAKAVNQQLTETLAGINYAKSITNTILQNVAVTPIYDAGYSQFFDAPSIVDATGRASVAAKFDIITNIIQNGISAVPPEVEGSTYTLTIDNGSFGNVDQNDSNNQDLIPGKIVRGKVSGAIGRIVTVSAGAAVDTLTVILLEPLEFSVGEGLEFASPFKRANITIRVESGTYLEDLPIKVPTGVSIKGDEFRRVLVRPKPRLSQSYWASTFFYRDTVIDGLTVTSTNFGRHYLQDPTDTLDIGPSYVNAGNYDTFAETILDAKLAVQNAVITYVNSLLSPGLLNAADEAETRRYTGLIVDALHLDLKRGGREQILEQQGNFLGVALSAQQQQGITYIATYINASVIASASITVKNIVTNAMTSIVYAFNASYNPPLDNREMDMFMMGEATILRNITGQSHGGFMCVLDPESQVLNKSPYIQTGASFSASTNAQAFRGGMFVDGGCGNMTMNVDIAGSVGPFELAVYSDPDEGLFIRKPLTPTAFFISGARFQVDAIKDYDGPAGTATLLLNAASNSGLGFTATSPDPFPIVLQTAGNKSLLSNDFTQVNDMGYGLLATNGALSEQVSMFTYYCYTAYYALNGAQIRSLNGSNANGVYGLVSEGSDPLELPDEVLLVENMVQVGKVYDNGTTYVNPAAGLTVYVYDLEYIPFNRSELEIDHDPLDSSVSLGVTRYEINNIEATPITVTGASVTRSGTVYKLNLSTAGSNNTATGGLQDDLYNLQQVTIRASQAHRFSGVIDVSPTRPSTALVFYNDNNDTVYRTTAFNITNSIGTALPANNVITTFDTAFDVVRLQIRPASAVLSTFAGAGGTTMGATAGDDVIAIELITEAADITRLNTGNMSFGWDGKTHRVINYIDRGTFATVQIADLTSINTSSAVVGIHSPLVRGAGTENIVLRCGLLANSNANITVKISTCRATGHDFLDIGSGSFNDSNYPNSVFGDPASTPTQENEVQERGKGRAFYVSTDQDGVFRVGRFFTVDQGTGSVTFSASIALSNLDGLGFKRGVVAAEFSTDSAMTDNASDTVPTESAVRGYVDRRLHYTNAGTLVVNPIGPGALARDGSTSFTGNISAGGFRLTTLGAPVSALDAATKTYVDVQLGSTDQLEDIRNVDIAGFAASQILIFNGRKRIFTNPESGGTFAVGNTLTGSVTGSTATIVDYDAVTLPAGTAARRVTYQLISGPDFTTADSVSTGGGVSAQVIDGPMNEIANAVADPASDITLTATRTTAQTNLNIQIVAGSILNADVNSAAAIAQSKLAMQAATTRVNAVGISQADLGLAAFDSGDFTVTNGWVSLASGGVDLADLPNVSQYQTFGKNTAGSGSPAIVGYADILNFGGALQDTEFATEVTAAPTDPGNALIRTGTSPYAYAFSNVTTSAEVNSLIKSDGAGNVDVGSLYVDGSKLLDANTGTNTNIFTTRGGIDFLTVVGNTVTNTTLTFTGRKFNFGGNTLPNSPTADTLQATGVNEGKGITTPHLFTRFIETDTVESGGTGIALGAAGGTFAGAGKVSIVLGGAVPFIFAGDADDSTIVTPGVYPDATDSYTIGNSTYKYKTIFATTFHGTATNALYADLAENYTADVQYDAGTVVMFGGDREVTISTGEANHKLAGVVSTKPAFLMNEELQMTAPCAVVAVALQGRVPCKVVGKINKGDMLTTSHTPGVAQAIKGTAELGTVIGKSLEHYDSDQVGIIEIAIGR